MSRSIAKFYCGSILIFNCAQFLGSCARSGSGQEPAPPRAPVNATAPEPTATPDPSLGPTSIPFDLLVGPALPSRTCIREQNIGEILPALHALAIDGSMDEWKSLKPVVPDIVGDAHDSFDITGLHVANAEGDLILGITGTPGPASASVFLEFQGFYVNRANQLAETLPIILRIKDGAVSVFHMNIWRGLSLADSVAFAASKDGFELKFGQTAMTAGVVAMPLWAVRAYTMTAEGELQDFTSYGYFTSLQQSIEPDFYVTSCLLSSLDGGLELLEIRDRRAPRVMTDRALQFERTAFIYVQELLGGAPWPVSHLAVLARSEGEALPITGHTLLQQTLRARLIDFRNLAIEGSEDVQQAGFLSKLVKDILKTYLFSQRPRVSERLLDIFARALGAKIESAQMGKKIFLDRAMTDSTRYLAIKEDSANEGFASARDQAFGNLLAASFSSEALLASWLAQGSDTDEAVLTSLVGKDGVLEKFWLGWWDNGAFHPQFNPSRLGDQDHDGVLNYIETNLLLNPEMLDSDNDGWPDYSELVVGTDPNNVIAVPNSIIRDGSFGDWQDLLPARIKADPDPAVVGCPGAADIQFFAALARKHDVLIGLGSGNSAPTDLPVVWYVNIDLLKLHRKFTIKARQGERHFELQDATNGALIRIYSNPMPAGMGALEVSLSAEALDLESGARDEVNFADPDSISIRIMTELAETPPKFCDDTVWFKPLISQP